MRAGQPERSPQAGTAVVGGEAGDPTKGSVERMKEPQEQGSEPGCLNDGTCVAKTPEIRAAFPRGRARVPGFTQPTVKDARSPLLLEGLLSLDFSSPAQSAPR